MDDTMVRKGRPRNAVAANDKASKAHPCCAAHLRLTTNARRKYPDAAQFRCEMTNLSA